MTNSIHNSPFYFWLHGVKLLINRNSRKLAFVWSCKSFHLPFIKLIMVSHLCCNDSNHSIRQKLLHHHNGTSFCASWRARMQCNSFVNLMSLIGSFCYFNLFFSVVCCRQIFFLFSLMVAFTCTYEKRLACF